MNRQTSTLDQIDAYFQRQAERAAEKRAQPHDPKVLLIDDDENFCLLVQHAFSARGIRIHTALTGAEGHAKAKSEPDDRYDLILLDLNLPDMSGADAFRLLKTDAAGMPVVICSGSPKTSDMNAILAMGGYFGFLEKPFDLDKLAEVFRHYRLAMKD